MVKLRLKSNFSDYYDPAFDEVGLEFRRFTDDGPSRVAMFQMFRALKIPTPSHGYYKDFLGSPLSGENFVVHENIKLHCGEGKHLLPFSKIDKNCPHFMVQHISTKINGCLSNVKSHSYRFLFVGDRQFRYEYISLNDWRSNCGDGDITGCFELFNCLPAWRNQIYYPIFAIDFVGSENDKKAIDFNIAPGLQGTGVNKLMGSYSAVIAIKNWYSRVIDEK